MISRGEVGLIVAGVGVSSGILTGDVYSTIVIMVAITTIITPVWLKMEFAKKLERAVRVLRVRNLCQLKASSQQLDYIS